MRTTLGRKIAAGMLVLAMVLGTFLHTETCEAATKKNYYIKINRQQNCVTIYEQDEKGKYTVPVKAMACSTGVNNATPKGKFKLGSKYRWHELYGKVYGQYCSRITDHVLFHSVYYSATDPSKLSYNAYNKLGNTASHGCVRLCVADAKWIYDNCASGTTVEIYDSKDPGPLGKPTPIRIDTGSKNRGWDPTDPNPKNPWLKELPTIKGAKNKTVERGSAKSALTSGVTATDYKGKKLKLKISGKYDLNKTGKYKITYKATDSRGNIKTVPVTITVKDTKKPKLTLKESEITITDSTSEVMSLSEMKAYFKSLAKATDSGKKLSSKYIVVDVTELWNAWENSTYGTYEVKVYAKDAAGNKSKAKTITVQYIDENAPAEPENPDNPENPENPENPVNPESTTDNPAASIDNSENSTDSPE